MGAHLSAAAALYALIGMAQATAIRSLMPREDRMPLIAILVIGAIVGTPVFIFGIFRAAARELV